MSLIRLEVESLIIQNRTNVAQLVSIKSLAKSGLLSQTGHEAVAKIVKRSQNPRARLFWIVYDCRGNWIHNHFSCTHSTLSQSVFKALGFEKIFPQVSIRNQNIATYWNLGAEGNIWNAVNLPQRSEPHIANYRLQWKFTRSRESESEWLERKMVTDCIVQVQKVPKKWKWNWIFKEEKW